MGGQDDAVGLFGQVGGYDVATLKLLVVPGSEHGFLLGHFEAALAKLGNDVVAAAPMSIAAGGAGAELALSFNEPQGAVGVELHGGHVVGLFATRRVAALRCALAGYESCGKYCDECELFCHGWV